jgi:hypothetical protein
MTDQQDISRHSENAAHQAAAKEKAKRPLDAACSGEVVHGFTLPPRQDASGCDWWPEFVAYFERVEGFTPHPRDAQHKRLFEYFVEGAFRQHEQSQNTEGLASPAGRC